MRDFEATATARADVGIVELHGQLDGRADLSLDLAYAEASSANATAVLLDFSAVTYINSTGIALIVGLLARARRENREIRACGLSDHYRQVFEITRLADFLTFFPTQDEAVGGSITLG